MCHSGLMWFAVTNTRRHFSGTSVKSMWPDSAIRRMRSSEYQPSFFAMATKSSFTSGISTPAWFRMNATAKSGSMPELQLAMMEMVPVGATVVTLQFRSFRIGRTRSPSGPRAALSSGPQMLCGPLREGAADLGQALGLDLGLLVHELLDLPAQLHALVGVVGDAQPHEQVGQAHDAEADAADVLGQLGDLAQRVLVGVDHVLEEVGRDVDHAAEAGPSRSSPFLTNAPRLMEPRLQTSYGRRGCSPQGLVAS